MVDVLIIDDSLTVRMDLKEAMEGAGFKVSLCATLQAARQAVASGALGALILDVHMPDGDGVDFLREIKTSPATAGIPVMLLSTEADLAERVRGISIDAEDYVGKPYDRERVVARVREFLSRRTTPAGELRERLVGRKVLAVDDSPTYLHELSRQLRQAGVEVVQARCGEEALKLLADQPVDCVLLDLMMPGLSGQETCRRIKSSPAWRGISVLMLTGLEDPQAMIASFNAGADDYIPKSGDFAVMWARLRAQFRRRQFEEENGRIRERLHQKEMEATEARASRELAEARATLLADLTKKNAELEESNRAMQSARKAAELASRTKDHFLAVLSHELRTPLTPVLATVSLLESTAGLSEDVRHSLAVIRRNAELEARLIDDLLDMTRISRGKVELNKRIVPISEIIHQAVEVCQADIEARQLEFGVDLGPCGAHLVEADPTRLGQVFWNLLKNAVKFTPHGGCIGVRCRVDGQHLLVEVSDSGEGIETEALTRIFNAFEQAERSIQRQFGGLGLGLAISKALVELHGGAITAHSDGKGKGATFRVMLPLAKDLGFRVQGSEKRLEFPEP